MQGNKRASIFEFQTVAALAALGTLIAGWRHWGIEALLAVATIVTAVALLGRLAVDRRHHGQGIGEFLLLDSLHRACEHAVDIAAAAMIVDAIDPAAAPFYQRFGFMPFPSRNTRLFLPMKTVAALFD